MTKKQHTELNPHVESILQRLNERTGLRFSDDFLSDISARIADFVDKSTSSNLKDFADRFTSDSPDFDRLVDDLTLRETPFFRDLAQFETIRDSLIPDVVQRQGTKAPIVAWVVGCSTGEEAYSLAIMLDQLGILDRSRILATDISRQALQSARKGMFRRDSFRGEFDARDAFKLQRYFKRKEGSWVLEDRIRNAVRFEFRNLAGPRDSERKLISGGFDLVVCRNELSWFDRSTVSAAVRRFSDALATGGWLITNRSHPSLQDHPSLESVAVDSGIVYRRNKVKAVTENTEVTRSFSVNEDFEPNDDAVDVGTVDVTMFDTIDVLTTLGDDSESSVDAPPESSSPDHFESQKSDEIPQLEDAPIPRQSVEYELPSEIPNELARGNLDSPEASLVYVESLAKLNRKFTREAAWQAVKRYPFSIELHYLRAMLLLEDGCEHEAVEVLQQVLALDPRLAVAHFTLGSIWKQLGDDQAAREAFCRTRDLCHELPPDEPIQLTESETASTLASGAQSLITILDLQDDL